MRRQTTKQPSGAATIASPMPARRARIRKDSPTSAPLLPVGLGAGARPGTIRGRGRMRLAGEIVAMVVAVVVEAEGAGGLRPEQAGILGMLRHRLRHARAAHVPVETD